MDSWISGAVEAANTLLGWIKSSPYKAVLAMLILSAAFLSLGNRLLTGSKIAAWALVLRLLAWAIFAFCGVWLVLVLLELAVRYGWKEIGWRSYLKTLTPAEKEVFNIFVSQNTTTQTFLATQLTAVSLAEKGFFAPVQPSFDRMKDTGFLPYEIRSRIFRHLKKNPHLLS